MRLQTFNCNPRVIDSRLRRNECVGEVFSRLGFDNRIRDLLELPEVTSEESEEEGASNRGGRSQDAFLKCTSEMNQVRVKFVIVSHWNLFDTIQPAEEKE